MNILPCVSNKECDKNKMREGDNFLRDRSEQISDKAISLVAIVNLF
jgi:hypothetical protein